MSFVFFFGLAWPGLKPEIYNTPSINALEAIIVVIVVIINISPDDAQ